jgi:hypothetical protein
VQLKTAVVIITGLCFCYDYVWKERRSLALPSMMHNAKPLFVRMLYRQGRITLSAKQEELNKGG